MRSELDDLLDEINSTIDTKPANRGTQSSYSNNSVMQSRSKPVTDTFASKDKTDLDQLLDDVCLVEDKNAPRTKPFKSDSSIGSNYYTPAPRDNATTVSTGAIGRKKKCWPPLLGNKDAPTFNSSQICEKLRCTSCDLRVQMFHGKKWSLDCNYLFFRNYFSNLSQLNSKLTPDSNTSAYACQCSWKTVNAVVPISNYTELKWVCAGH